MREVILAKTAGFCFGVRRAVDLTEKAARSGERCCTLGPIIHNRHVVDRLRDMGVGTIERPEEAERGTRVVIRSHGVAKGVVDELEARDVSILDATCPDVKKIHEIVAEASWRGRQVVIIGERHHPEVEAICGWCDHPLVFGGPGELETWLKTGNGTHLNLTLVFQTTGNAENVDMCRQILKKECTSSEIFDTICNATSKRQQEAAELASHCDAMVVIGGRNSANSLRLQAICEEHCPEVLFIEGADELRLDAFSGADTVGIVAGASTPAWIIKEVYQTMSDEIKKIDDETSETATEPVTEAVEDAAEAAPETAPEAPVVEAAPEEAPAQESTGDSEEVSAAEDESFEAMLERSIKTLHTGEKVIGVVAAITPTEISVDLGTKQSGYIPISELTDDPDAKVEDLVEIGKEVETYVMRVNDVEGTVMLSKKRLDTVKNWDEIDQARENKTIVEGIVTEENKGGVVASVKGVRVFIPASQTGIPKDQPMNQLVRQRVRLRITEVNQSRRRVVGSIRLVASEERRAKAEKTWAEIEKGKRYTGVVKSITSYGAFVDIGGVDGMVHVSELSWGRIKSPADVVKVGQELEVYVISFDKEKGKISLGYKDPDANPWKVFTDKYEKGSVARVKVVKLMPFGAFAEIVPGVDGLIHISQIADRRIGRPDEFLSEGQEIDVKIVDIDFEKKNVSLSIRALIEEPGGDSAPPQQEEQYDNGGGGQGEDSIVYDTDVNKPTYEEEEAPAQEAAAPREEAPAEPAEEAPAAEPEAPVEETPAE